MYKYLIHLKRPENQAEVSSILQPIFETDILNAQAVKINLESLDKLKAIGETEIYERVREDLKTDPVYKEIML